MPTPVHNKRSRGQYYTVGNPFLLQPFADWFHAIPGHDRARILEPFAGACDIPELMRCAGFEAQWSCFDIDPPRQSRLPVSRQDTLKRFPSGYAVGITNPPYLARNSATRRGLPWAGGPHHDVYLHALEKMLNGLPYVAAIIPESFINRGGHDPRLHCVVSLPWRMFSDTDHPVCLAMFNPVACPYPQGPSVFSANKHLGGIHELEQQVPVPVADSPWVFNDPDGSIGLHAIDGNKGPSIRFLPGRLVDPSCIKSTSRAITRVSGVSPRRASSIITRANDLLGQYRSATHDVFMTSFKGLRADGRYRRRLDFQTARAILDLAQAQ